MRWSMVLDKFLCPECKGAPRGTVDTVPAICLIDFGEDGVPYNVGESKVCWDGQTTDRDAAGNVLFQCGACFHEYAVPGVTKVE